MSLLKVRIKTMCVGVAAVAVVLSALARSESERIRHLEALLDYHSKEAETYRGYVATIAEEASPHNTDRVAAGRAARLAASVRRTQITHENWAAKASDCLKEARRIGGPIRPGSRAIPPGIPEPPANFGVFPKSTYIPPPNF